MKLTPSHPGRVHLRHDLVYASPCGIPLLADLYIPADCISPAPVIVWIHGGGWRFGDRKLGPNLSRFFAESGFAMASFDYRLSTQAIFPAPLEDIKTGIRWLRSVAREFNLDASRIGLFGSSSGGHLAALAALTSDQHLGDEPMEYSAFSTSVQAVVDGYGPTDFLEMDGHRLASPATANDEESRLLRKNKLSAEADSFESLLVGGPIHDRLELVRQANPVNYATAGVPFAILHGLADSLVPAHQSELLFDALAKAGADATLCLIENLNHGFLNKNEFGEGEPHRVLMKRTLNGSPVQTSELPNIGFGYIESFFIKHLGPV